jgi:hypothetical protein
MLKLSPLPGRALPTERRCCVVCGYPLKPPTPTWWRLCAQCFSLVQLEAALCFYQMVRP